MQRNSRIKTIILIFFQIAISATTEHGDKPWYLEECSATLASAYSSGQMNSGERDIVCILFVNNPIKHLSFY
jgi:hypothetical protein